MRNSFAISSALAARLLSILPLISQCYSATTTTQVQKGDSFWQIAHEHGVTVESLEAANPGVSTFNLYVGQTINVPVANDVPAIDDTVTTLVFASGSQTAKTGTPTASVISSNDVPAMSDFVTGSLVFASVSQTAKTTTPSASVTSSNDVPAMSDFVTGSLVFASVSQTAGAASAIFKPTSNDVPGISDFITGSIVFASASQTAKVATPTTLVTSSRPSASSSAAPALPIRSKS